MSDVPSPDIPNPASRNPAGSPVNRPVRTIIRPDATQSTRLPGTYATSYGKDPSWRRGAAMLWLLFGLAALAELARGVVIVFSGFNGWAPQVELTRIAIEAVGFLLIWVGWNWPRWILVAINFLTGLWFLLRVVNPQPLKAMWINPNYPPMPGLSALPQLVLALVYLAIAAYLMFSSDLSALTAHRRSEGRGWVLIPIALLAAVFVFLFCTIQPLRDQKYQQWKPEATQYATDSLKAMAQQWDVAAYDERADADYLKTWSKENRQLTFGTLKGHGQLKSELMPKTSEPRPALDPAQSGFLVRYQVDFGTVQFEHGHIDLGLIVSRHLTGPWRLENLLASNEVGDPEPTPTPAVAPEPGPGIAVPPVPGTPTTAATPAATTPAPVLAPNHTPAPPTATAAPAVPSPTP